jgi:hypothetical protein
MIHIDFLQGDNIGIIISNDSGQPVRGELSIQPYTAMDIVGHDSEQMRRAVPNPERGFLLSGRSMKKPEDSSTQIEGAQICVLF